jgi:hypothetical protein
MSLLDQAIVLTSPQQLCQPDNELIALVKRTDLYSIAHISSLILPSPHSRDGENKVVFIVNWSESLARKPKQKQRVGRLCCDLTSPTWTQTTGRPRISIHW